MNGRSGSEKIRVLVVEDQALVRRGLVRLLELEDTLEVVDEAADGAEVLEKLVFKAVDVALVDVRMPGMDGVEFVGRLAHEHPRVAAIMLTTFDDDEYIFGGLRAGARGFLLKETSPEELVAAIEEVHAGGTVLGSPVAGRVVAELKRSTGQAGMPRSGAFEESLTPREVEVAGLIGRGMTNEEISRELYISEGTARNHVSNIMKKLDLRDRTRLALYAARRWPFDAH